ncbi:MAG: rRNA maturation RNase YbeY [Prevotellaceae bacterium]|jgi:rRNA maturation RNase YbeY|nr:rRNA maturation RNase YbeY [Prevotellaceae bacterium]
MIGFYSEGAPFPLKGKKWSVKKQIVSLIEMENRKAGDLCFVFCTDDYLLEINKKHLDHDYYTDVITFDYTTDNAVSGDIFISVERVTENAAEFDVSFNHELSRVMYHGVLHLCGYNDKSDDEKQTMQKKEDFYLKTFSITE